MQRHHGGLHIGQRLLGHIHPLLGARSPRPPNSLQPGGSVLFEVTFYLLSEFPSFRS